MLQSTVIVVVNVMNIWIYNHLQCCINRKINKLTLIEQIQQVDASQMHISVSCKYLFVTDWSHYADYEEYSRLENDAM
jgi:hypothetical protein